MTWVTADLPGCGGRIKVEPEDFQVEELPAYEPSGAGEHLYLWVRKRDVDTPQAARAIARAVGLTTDEVSYAGLKDRRAVTWQYFSVPATAEPRLGAFADERIQILRSARHGNRLRTGHLRGNRFRIRVREPQSEAAAQAVVAALAERGFANFFGTQRFGRSDDNAELGRRLLKGERLPRRPSRFERKLYLSAFQSLLFNALLERRLREQTWRRARVGEVMKKVDSGGVFRCSDPATDQARVDAFEISPAGPIFGPKMVEAGAAPAAEEAEVLAAHGVSLEDFRRGKGETEGARRAQRLPLRELEVTREGGDLWLSFQLPRGSYATVVLAEVIKAPTPGAEADASLEHL